MRTVNFKASNNADVSLLVLFVRSITNESDTTDEPRVEGRQGVGEGAARWTREVLEF